MKHSVAAVPADLRNSLASGSVTEAWVSLRRRSPRQSVPGLRPPPAARRGRCDCWDFWGWDFWGWGCWGCDCWGCWGCWDFWGCDCWSCGCWGWGCADAAPAAAPVLGLKLLCDAHASNRVPSTLKCSLEQYRRSFAASTTAAKNRSAISWSNNRCRFFDNVDASKPRSSMRSPRNHLNNMS